MKIKYNINIQMYYDALMLLSENNTKPDDLV